MAHHKSAKKRIRIAENRRVRNRAYKSRMKTAMKKVLNAESKEAAMEAVHTAYAIIDKLVSKGILAKNTGANKKSRLMRYINSMN